MSELTIIARSAAVLHDYINDHSASLEEIAARHGVTKQTVANIAKRADIPLRSDMIAKRVGAALQKAVKAYKDNPEMSVPMAAKRYKIGNTTLRKRLQELGVPIRNCMDFGSRALKKWRTNQAIIEGGNKW